jgi:uncharacterized membrane protein YdjX (TVP38/TMEM64 family)
MSLFSQEGTIDWLVYYGNGAWLVAIFLLMADLLLPLPATLIMSALGYIYGPVLGGVISTVGAFAAGSFGYWLCRMMGEGVAIKLLGQKDFERGKKLSSGIGVWVVVLSRWLPVFPEVVSCMAGLTRMQARTFHLALLCGSLPLGFVFAYVGHTGVMNPVLAISLSAGLPPIIWLIAQKLLKKYIAT